VCVANADVDYGGLEPGENIYRSICFFVEIVKTILNSHFYYISPDFNPILSIFEFLKRF